MRRSGTIFRMTVSFTCRGPPGWRADEYSLPPTRKSRRCSTSSQPSASPNQRRLSAGSAQAAKRSEEHTSELQSLMRISYAVFCLKKKKKMQHQRHKDNETHNASYTKEKTTKTQN